MIRRGGRGSSVEKARSGEECRRYGKREEDCGGVIRIANVGTEGVKVCDIGDVADEPGRGCGKAEEVLVVPEGLCGECWSRKAIVAWR